MIRGLTDLPLFSATCAATAEALWARSSAAARRRGWFCIRGKFVNDIVARFAGPSSTDAISHRISWQSPATASASPQRCRNANGPDAVRAVLRRKEAQRAGLEVVVRLDRLGLLLRRREALEALEQFLLSHAVEHDLGVVGVHSLARGADQRHGLGFGLVHLDIFLQRVDEVLLEVAG